MKKNVIFRIAAIVLMCTLVTACFASSTFAKYTSSATVNGNALTVAKWSFEVKGQEIAVKGTAPTVNLDLFTTILDTNGGAKETDVKENLIAPGTKGAFDFTVQNKSEVNAKYTITAKRTVNNADLKEAVVVMYNGNPVTWNNDDTATIVTDEPIAMEQSAPTTLPFTWEWAYERTDKDATDTGIGIDAKNGVTYDIDFTITATQVD